MHARALLRLKIPEAPRLNEQGAAQELRLRKFACLRHGKLPDTLCCGRGSLELLRFGLQCKLWA